MMKYEDSSIRHRKNPLPLGRKLKPWYYWLI